MSFRGILVRSFGPSSVMKVESLPLASLAPKKDQVLIKVHAAGVNPVDTYLRKGQYTALPNLPYTPGKDAAGVVHEIGEGVTKFQKGDRVYTLSSISGTYAEMSLCHQDMVQKLPEKASFEEGACFGVPYFTAFRALFHRGHAKAGDTVLVHGASGGVGIACIQWAKSRGIKVIGTAGSQEGLKLIRELGADFAVDHNQPGHYEEIMKLTEGKGVDLIVEMLANHNLGRDLPILAPRGRVAVVGNRGTVEINPRDLMGKETDIFGVMLFNASREEMDEVASELCKGYDAGNLRPVVGQTFPLEKAPEAHDVVVPADRPSSGSQGRVVLRTSNL